MSAGSNNILIQVNDGVAPTIEPKIKGIAAAAIDADAALTALKGSLGSINSGSLQGLSSSLRGISTSTTTLKNSTAAMGTIAVKAASQINTLTFSYAGLEKQLISTLAVLNTASTALQQAGAGANAIGKAASGAATGVGRLENAGAQVVGRLVGVETGAGAVGGALARLGVAAGVAGPLIIAGLAIGAIVAAIEIYKAYEESARKVIETQGEIANTENKLNDRFLEQNEALTKLTKGPLAAYAQQLKDLPLKSISVEIGDITKDLEAQKSTIASILSYFERLGTVASQGSAQLNQRFGAGSDVRKGGTPPGALTNQEAKDFIDLQDSLFKKSGATKAALDADLSSVGKKLVDIHNLEEAQKAAGLTTTLTITEQGRNAIQLYYNRLLDYLRDYNQKEKAERLEAAGATIAVQKELAAQQLKDFEQELGQRKQMQDRFTIQDQKQLREQQKAGDLTGRSAIGLGNQAALPLNQKAMDTAIGSANQAILKQNDALRETVTRFTAAQEASAAYTIEAKIRAAQDQEDAALTKQYYGNEGLGAAIETTNKAIEVKIRDADAIREQAQLYGEFREPALKYQAAIDGITRSLKAHEIGEAEAGIATVQASRRYQEAIDPLFRYKEGIRDEIALLGTYGEAGKVAAEVQRVQNDLREQGRSLSAQDADALSRQLTQLQLQQQLQNDVNKLYRDNIDIFTELIVKQQALTEAKEKGIITEQQYKIATAQNNVEIANQRVLQEKGATLQDQLVAGIGKYIKGYQGLTKGISDAYGQAFQTIAEGAADSIGRAIFFADDLGEAMSNTARQAGAELIGMFIKLALQWIITATLGKALQAGVTASTVGQAAALSAAWAPAAALASLATSGANAIGASAGIAGTFALTEGLSAVTTAISTATSIGGGNASSLGRASGGGIGLIGGGYVGFGPHGIDKVAANLTRGEFVMNPAATKRNRANLEAMNNGRPTTGSVGNGGLKVNVIHDGSTAIAVQQIDEDTVHVIAKRAAEQVVQAQAPSIVAAQMSNPNSRMSKSVQQYTDAKRKR
jgi:hypothetical protein